MDDPYHCFFADDRHRDHGRAGMVKYEWARGKREIGPEAVSGDKYIVFAVFVTDFSEEYETDRLGSDADQSGVSGTDIRAFRNMGIQEKS